LVAVTHVQSKEAAKGRFWFVETDLKSGSAIRMDKTGKSILMLLRHLGRLVEVRPQPAPAHMHVDATSPRSDPVRQSGTCPAVHSAHDKGWLSCDTLALPICAMYAT
jgi:hypothetical protein